VSRTVREREAERAAVVAAIDRLLAGTPLRSTSGKLTASELIIECGLRRDVVYADYKDLLEGFQARVKAQDHVPAAMRDLAAENTQLKEELAETRSDLANERAAGAALRQVIAELSLELQQTKDELVEATGVTPLRWYTSTAVNGPC
jgi:hypothetical protein